MLARLADLSYRRKWLVLGLWLVALITVTAASSAWAGDWRSDARLDGTDAQQAYDLAAKHFPSKTHDAGIAVFAVPGGVETQRAAIASFVDDVAAVAGVADIGSPFADGEGGGQIASSGSIAFAPIDFRGDADLDATVEAIKARAVALRDAGVTTELSGTPFAEGELPASEVFGLLAAAVILLIAFGSVVAAGLPLVTAVIGIGNRSGRPTA